VMALDQFSMSIICRNLRDLAPLQMENDIRYVKSSLPESSVNGIRHGVCWAASNLFWTVMTVARLILEIDETGINKEGFKWLINNE
jgi:hypothetical protein